MVACARQRGEDLDLGRMFDVVTFERFKEEGLPTKRLKQERPHVGFLIDTGGNPEQIVISASALSVPRFRPFAIGWRATLAASTATAPVTAEPYNP
jgi:hypothetical protein